MHFKIINGKIRGREMQSGRVRDGHESGMRIRARAFCPMPSVRSIIVYLLCSRRGSAKRSFALRRRSDVCSTLVPSNRVDVRRGLVGL